jgi:dihydrodipicolinate synthase/N-acetylneuraminate lyase
MIDNFKSNSVYPISPSYDESGDLDLKQTEKYIEFLSSSGADVLMTTAGTSQFNLLSAEEVRKLNDCCANSFDGIKILGIPALSSRELEKEVSYYNQNYSTSDNIILLLLYPERYYSDELIVDYFKKINDVSQFPIMLHGMIMRKGNGGVKDFDSQLINKIIQQTDKIIGMKEECASFELAYDLIRNIPTDFITIVAGKSIRRFEFLKRAGATTFLSGVGSFCPSFEKKYFSSSNKVDFLRQEDKFFDTFMSIGWHKSMRAALRLMNLSCSHNRDPFPSTDTLEDERIKSLIEEVQRWTKKQP